MRWQIARARAYYARAAAGIGWLTGFGAQRMVRLMGALYAGILGDIEARGYDVFSSRAHVTLADKLSTGLATLVDTSGVDRPLVGTSPACQLRLTDPHVSRRHLVMEATPRGLSVVDVGSTNGTSIHGVTIREATVEVGARILVGDTMLRVDAATEISDSLPEADSFGRLLGASRASLAVQFLGEAIGFSMIALVIAVVLVKVALAVTPLNDLMDHQVTLDLLHDPALLAWVLKPHYLDD